MSITSNISVPHQFIPGNLLSVISATVATGEVPNRQTIDAVLDHTSPENPLLLSLQKLIKGYGEDVTKSTAPDRAALALLAITKALAARSVPKPRVMMTQEEPAPV